MREVFLFDHNTETPNSRQTPHPAKGSPLSPNHNLGDIFLTYLLFIMIIVT